MELVQDLAVKDQVIQEVMQIKVLYDPTQEPKQTSLELRILDEIEEAKRQTLRFNEQIGKHRDEDLSAADSSQQGSVDYYAAGNTQNLNENLMSYSQSSQGAESNTNSLAVNQFSNFSENSRNTNAIVVEEILASPQKVSSTGTVTSPVVGTNQNPLTDTANLVDTSLDAKILDAIGQIAHTDK